MFFENIHSAYIVPWFCDYKAVNINKKINKNKKKTKNAQKDLKKKLKEEMSSKWNRLGMVRGTLPTWPEFLHHQIRQEWPGDTWRCPQCTHIISSSRGSTNRQHHHYSPGPEPRPSRFGQRCRHLLRSLHHLWSVFAPVEGCVCHVYFVRQTWEGDQFCTCLGLCLVMFILSGRLENEISFVPV